MKAKKFKNAMTALMILANMTFGNTFAASEFTIPTISSPDILKEGTQRELSANQVAELLPWAKNSKIYIKDLLEQINNLPMDQKIDSLMTGLKQAVLDSAPKNSELIMRYSLNRAFVVVETLDREMDVNVPGTVDAKARVLIRSAEFALKYADKDIESLSSKSSLPFADFGKDYFNFLHELNKSIFDASAQYMIQKTALEFFQWDLYRDLNNKVYASQITKINSTLVRFPKEAPVQDAKSIAYIRQLKVLITQLDMNLGNEEKSADRKKFEESLAAQKIKKETSETDNDLLKPGYSAYYKKCYKSGNIMSDELPLEECVNTYATGANGKCYAVDFYGTPILSKEYPASSCGTGQAKKDGVYRSDNGVCRALDNAGYFIKSRQFPANLCAAKYRSNNGKCQALDESGYFVTNENFPGQLCAAKYRSNNGKCQALDEAGYFVTTENFPARLCAAKYRSNNGKCQALDEAGYFVTTENFPPQACAAKYRSNNGKCQALDEAGYFVTTSNFSASTCAARYTMSKGSCYALDESGYIITTETFSEEACMAR